MFLKITGRCVHLSFFLGRSDQGCLKIDPAPVMSAVVKYVEAEGKNFPSGNGENHVFRVTWQSPAFCRTSRSPFSLFMYR